MSHNFEIHAYYDRPSIIETSKSHRLKWARRLDEIEGQRVGLGERDHWVEQVVGGEIILVRTNFGIVCVV